jgi:RHH-type rel operon transcriptional repressor/antitoxin RelB
MMPITVRLGDSVEKRLDELAKLTGRTKTYYIRQALEEKLDDLEDLYTAEHRLEQPEGERWSLDQLERGDDLES